MTTTTTGGRNRYTARDISVLKGLEPVRRRPAMYIGGADSRGLHHLVWEILDNAIDEAINGYASTVELVLDPDGEGIRVTDNGRGIPVDIHPETRKPALETILTTLHAGGKFEPGNYIHSGGLHGVGSSVVNALSEQLVVRVRRDGFEYEQRYRRGKPTTAVKELGTARGSGTSVYFKPDPQIFPRVRFDPDRIREVLEARAYLHRGLRIVFDDQTSGRKDVFQFADGVKAYLAKLVRERGFKPTQDFIFTLDRERDPRLELALQWTDETAEFIRSYVNGVHTAAGGTHEQGLKAGVVRAVRNYIESHDLQPRGLTLTGEDIREGLSGVLSLYLLDPQFQGQTKERLNNPEVANQISAAVGSALEHYFNQNGSVANGVVARVILAARARAASRAAANEVTRKSAVSHRLNLPGKLADCESTRPQESELIIVEGDSAGGSAKQARDRRFQAILPLRGKVLNTEQASASKVLSNKEISDIVSALGCGVGKSFDVAKLRYHRVIILTDADSDGHHIATLLLTFFYRYLSGLLDGGHVYLGLPPLYRIDTRNGPRWAWDEGDRARIEAELGSALKPDAVTRFKGLGEMSPAQLKETTMDPRSRTLQRVLVVDPLETDRVVSDLMGKDAAARYRFVMERAGEADDLDL